MTVLIGGAGSTGSSLLKTILNRHPDVFSGNELNFFNKEQIFENWNHAKKRLLKKIPYFTTKGWFPYPGTNLLNEDYGWKKDRLLKLISESNDLKIFTEKFFNKPLKKNNAKIWIEKTPSNSYSFNYFLNLFKNKKVIHTTRNPYDTVTSLVNRGITPIYAVGMWIYNTALALRVANSERYFEIKYEEFVSNPKKELENLMDFLDLEFNESILDPSDSGSTKKIESWRSDPGKEISKTSIGRFKRIDKELQQEIITALSVFHISETHIKSKNIRQNNCVNICKKLGYRFESKIYSEYHRKIKRDLNKDFLYRSFHFYSTGWSNYPARLRWTND
jgi:hypothetical protein